MVSVPDRGDGSAYAGCHAWPAEKWAELWDISCKRGKDGPFWFRSTFLLMEDIDQLCKAAGLKTNGTNKEHLLARIGLLMKVANLVGRGDFFDAHGVVKEIAGGYTEGPIPDRKEE
jgi:hypothetical protein